MTAERPSMPPEIADVRRAVDAVAPVDDAFGGITGRAAMTDEEDD